MEGTFCYQIVKGPNETLKVDRIEFPNIAGKDVGHLRDAILRRNSNHLAHCDPRHLKIYEKGTTIENYPTKHPLGVSVPLNDDQIKGTTETEPLLVVVPSSNLAGSNVNTQQQVSPDSPEDIASLVDFVRTLKVEDETLIISHPKTKTFRNAMEKLNLKTDAAEWCEKPEFGPAEFPPFTWLDSKDDSRQNREAYMAYLRKNIPWPQETKLFEGSLAKDLLSVDVLGFDTLKTSGNIDVVLTSSRHQEIHTVRQHILMGIELKKDTTKGSENIERQVILQHVAASYLNDDTGVLTMMTDLRDRWLFFWFAEGKRLIRYAATTSEAMFLIQHSQDEDADGKRQSNFPTSFLNRACWNDLFCSQLDSIAEVESSDEKDDGEGAHLDQGSGGTGSLAETGDPSISQQVRSSGMGSTSRTYGKSHRSNRSGKKHTQMGGVSLEYMDEEEKLEAILQVAFHKMIHIPRVKERRDADILPREIVWDNSEMA